MFRIFTFNTLATLTMFTLVVQPLFAQEVQPIESTDLPLRTPTPVRAPEKTNQAPARPLRNARGQEDISQVPPKKCVKKTGTINFAESSVSVTALVDQVSRALCVSFIIPSDIAKGGTTLTITSRNPIKIENLWQIFVTALDSNQFALERVGEFYKLVKGGTAGADISKKVIPVYERGQKIPSDEATITYIYAPRNISMTQASALIGQLSKAPTTAGEYLVFSDSAANIRRIQTVLDRIDVSGSAYRVHVVEPEHASPSDLKKKLGEIFKTDSPNRGFSPNMGMRAGRPEDEKGATTQMIDDDRTNKLIIIAPDKTYERISEMIATLDTPGSGPASQVSVYTLNNATAKDLATTLSTLVSNAKPAGAANQPRSPFNAPVQEGQFEGEIKIAADEKTNSLLVYSSSRDFKALAKVIEKLDKRRPQVFIEAVLMEVAVSDATDFGLNIFSALPVGNIPGIGNGLGIVGNAGGQKLAGDVFNSFKSTASLGSAAQTAASLGSFISTLGVLGTTPITLAGQTINVPSFGATLNFLEKFGTVDILQKPTLMTVDNEKATIEVGSRVPQTTGISTIQGVAGGLGGFTNSIQPVDVTNKLEITTHTNENDEILLEIKQTVNDLGETISIPGAGDQYTIRKKFTDTRVMTRDQQTIVIGGLISHNKSHSENKLPWLGDIPIIGHAFKTNNDKVLKSNLLLVLTPYIIRSPADNLKIYERKKKEQDDFAKMYFGDKITKFDPYIDYDKKPGPIAKMLHEVDVEMSRVQNGGPGLPGEIVIRNEPGKGRETTLRTTLPEIPTGDADEQNAFPIPMPMPMQMPEPVYTEPPATGQVAPVDNAAPGQPNVNIQPPAGTPPPPNVIVPQ